MLYNFLIKNLIISISLASLTLILVIFEINNFIQSKNSINTQKAIDLINHQNGIIIDVRNENDFKKCHIINSINIPNTKINNNKNFLKKFQKKNVIIIHETNSKAQKTVTTLKLNLIKVLYIKDGIDAWIKNNLPTNSIK